MLELLEFAFSSFWHFVGVLILINVPPRLIFLCWNRFLRSRSIKTHGWPPAHCDADGDFKSEKRAA